ncbi:predicted protein [Nematostella vectensis]|uniref:Uncharacterized protein n=1 Tax=Nematostella vectensis TaxID=45351 RepID=A7RN96_NEMVE|nr:predicted protein [Nematostella vectensis]|eukprot:XP_001639164.1 predicted protein [Nematostella vectensis]
MEKLCYLTRVLFALFVIIDHLWLVRSYAQEYVTDESCKIKLKYGETIELKHTDYVMKIGSRIKLKCAPLPEKKTTVEWFKNGEVLRTREGRIIARKKKKRKNQRLIIRDIKPSDEGCYSCYAPRDGGLKLIKSWKLFVEREKVKPPPVLRRVTRTHNKHCGKPRPNQGEHNKHCGKPNQGEHNKHCGKPNQGEHNKHCGKPNQGEHNKHCGKPNQGEHNKHCGKPNQGEHNKHCGKPNQGEHNKHCGKPNQGEHNKHCGKPNQGEHNKHCGKPNQVSRCHTFAEWTHPLCNTFPGMPQHLRAISFLDKGNPVVQITWEPPLKGYEHAWGYHVHLLSMTEKRCFYTCIQINTRDERLYWTFTKDILPDTTYRLFVQSLPAMHYGNRKNIASVKVRSATKASLLSSFLAVHNLNNFTDDPQLKDGPVVVRAEEGSPLRLRCTFTSDALQDVWFKDYTILNTSKSEHLIVKRRKKKNGKRMSVLVFSKISRRDKGLYLCVLQKKVQAAWKVTMTDQDGRQNRKAKDLDPPCGKPRRQNCKADLWGYEVNIVSHYNHAGHQECYQINSVSITEFNFSGLNYESEYEVRVQSLPTYDRNQKRNLKKVYLYLGIVTNMSAHYNKSSGSIEVTWDTWCNKESLAGAEILWASIQDTQKCHGSKIVMKSTNCAIKLPKHCQQFNYSVRAYGVTHDNKTTIHDQRVFVNIPPTVLTVVSTAEPDTNTPHIIAILAGGIAGVVMALALVYFIYKKYYNIIYIELPGGQDYNNPHQEELEDNLIHNHAPLRRVFLQHTPCCEKCDCVITCMGMMLNSTGLVNARADLWCQQEITRGVTNWYEAEVRQADCVVVIASRKTPRDAQLNARRTDQEDPRLTIMQLNLIRGELFHHPNSTKFLPSYFMYNGAEHNVPQFLKNRVIFELPGDLNRLMYNVLNIEKYQPRLSRKILLLGGEGHPYERAKEDLEIAIASAETEHSFLRNGQPLQPDFRTLRGEASLQVPELRADDHVGEYGYTAYTDPTGVPRSDPRRLFTRHNEYGNKEFTLKGLEDIDTEINREYDFSGAKSVKKTSITLVDYSDGSNKIVENTKTDLPQSGLLGKISSGSYVGGRQALPPPSRWSPHITHKNEVGHNENTEKMPTLIRLMDDNDLRTETQHRWKKGTFMKHLSAMAR